VRVEFGILVLVLAATAWLIQTPPAKVQLQPQLVDQTEQLGSGGSVQMTVDPAAVGSNLIHVYVFDEDLQLDDEVTDFTLTAFNDKRGLGPLAIDAGAAGPGHFQANRVTIPFDGTWRLEASVRRGKFDEERARFSITIAPQRNQE
jgi:copper transport protein